MRKFFVIALSLIVIAAMSSSFMYIKGKLSTTPVKSEHTVKHSKSTGHRFIRRYYSSKHVNRTQLMKKFKKGDRTVLRGVRYIVR